MGRMAFGVLMALLAVGVSGAEVSVPYEFTTGEPARAAQVNKNFSELVKAVNDSLNQIQALQQENGKLKQSVVDLGKQLKAQKDENARLNKAVSGAQSSIKTLNGENARLKKAVSDTQAAMSRNHSELKNLVQQRRTELTNLINARGIHSLRWTSSNPGRDKLKGQGYACIQILEAADPHTWKDNWLCFKRKP